MIQLSEVTKTYDVNGVPLEAIKPLELTINEGEFVTLIGASGCGKTTILRILADLSQPSRGSVRIAGMTPRQACHMRDIGFVFQQPALLEWRSVAENIRLPLELAGLGQSQRAAAVAEILELVGLTDFARHYPRELSGGMQQRVALARALVIRPKVLLMDEPFGALDEITRDAMNVELARVVERTGSTVVFVTHSIREAVYLSDRIIILSPRPGRIIDTLSVDLSRPRPLAVRQGAEFHRLADKGLSLLEVGLDER